MLFEGFANAGTDVVKCKARNKAILKGLEECQELAAKAVVLMKVLKGMMKGEEEEKDDEDE